jgi:SnoaL-like domain
VAYNESDVQELISRQKIYDVLTRYCRALDHCEGDLMRLAYWDDGIDDQGMFATLHPRSQRSHQDQVFLNRP